MAGFLWLRQICLVARVLAPVEAALGEVFRINACYRENLFGGKFGLHNVIFPINGAFLEVISLHPGVDPKNTPAGRYLERRKGDGGYMVILECNDVDRREKHMNTLGVRIVLHPKHDVFNEIQLHPSDTGGALIAINETAGRQGFEGPYSPAGPEWWLKATPSDLTSAILAAELQSPDPEALAAKWGAVLEREVTSGIGGVPTILLEIGSLRFVPARDGRGEGLGGVDLAITNRERVLKAAVACGLHTENDVVHICGTRFYLVQA